ncbi:hypothetical protein BMETH_1605_1 [methanotrophic bacterial endosymbiont of Bathymodiolus sp.]|nr:hypothetical protein BMETH_1605_1 [methanotrophic bacterial endosymbiont of Bathymodiolus sp.]
MCRPWLFFRCRHRQLEHSKIEQGLLSELDALDPSNLLAHEPLYCFPLK